MTVLPEEHARHVLVVEDDRSLCRLVEVILRREGWNVTCAPNGNAALDVLQTDLPDVLLLDLMLPDTSGFEVLDWIERTNPSWLPHVIVFTAASNKVIALLEEKHRVGRILRKPFELTELVNGIASSAVR
ncbi:MAG TPA: response regulator [Vicinamibacterales bacterium]